MMVRDFGTNKVSIEYTMIIGWNGMEWNGMICVDSMLELFIDFDKISESPMNIYESNPINQTILEIDFDRTYWNESGRWTF